MNYCPEIAAGLYYIGANDRRLSRFENMFELATGVSYNSYLLKGEKTVVFDGIDSAVSELHFDAINQVLAGRPLDYLVVHHVEPDHCASITAILRYFPEATMVISKRGLSFLQQFYPNTADEGLNFEARAQIVGEGDELDLGDRKLSFIDAPNVHWPEVIMSYDNKSKTLFSADAFGSFKAIDGHLFADQVDYDRDWLDEARRYYINIVGRQGAAVQKVLKKAGGLDIKMICPLHGLIFRTPESIQTIINKYDIWSSYRPEIKGALICYSSMYGNTALVADKLAGALSQAGVKHIRVHDVAETEISEIISDMFCYSHIILSAMNYNTELFPKMDALLREVKMLNFGNRRIAFMNSMSWGGRSLPIAREILSGCKDITEITDPFVIKSALDSSQLEDLGHFAADIAADLEAYELC